VTVGYTMDACYFRALNPYPVQIDRGITSLDFTITETILHDCSVNHTAGSSYWVFKTAIVCNL